MKPSKIIEKLKTAPSRFTPVRIKKDVDVQTIAFIEEHRDELRGIDYVIENKRHYTNPKSASHILGYVREASKEIVKSSGGYYKLGDFVGYSGVEKSYETILRGKRGYEFVLVDALGRFVGRYNDGKNDIPQGEGSDVVLTIDSELQSFIENLFKDKTGSAVVIDPNTGEILAMVSSPGFDLSLLSGYTSVEEWKRLNADPKKPLLNRAIQGLYSPGSTFKLMLAVTALETGVIDTTWEIYCPGYFRLGRKVFKCHGVHGRVRLKKAIEVSCNVFFYNLMLKVKFSDWTHFGSLFGFGKKTGIDLPGEVEGILPSPEFYDSYYGKGRWTRGNLVNLAIGQGEISVTPLQMACYAMVFANGGTFHQPHVVKKIIDRKTGRIESVEYSTIKLPISKKTMDIVRRAMYLVVNGDRGTGRLARVPGIKVAGKTGTAQNPHGEDHSWFIGFAPFDSPEIAFAIIVENAGFGGSVAAPMASKIVKKYFELKKKRIKPQIALIN